MLIDREQLGHSGDWECVSAADMTRVSMKGDNAFRP